MENQFFIDSEFLSEKALEKKHRLETDPSFRKNHMEYLPGMEKIQSDVCENVINQMEEYDYTRYTAADVKAALEHESCSVEDFKALLSPAAEPFLEKMAQKASRVTSRHFGNTVYFFTPLYIANYCENYCVYCGFNCYNHINRMKLSMEQIEKEMKVIADCPVARSMPDTLPHVNITSPCFTRSRLARNTFSFNSSSMSVYILNLTD